MSYLRPTDSLEITHIIKKSHFIGHLAKVNSKADALAYIKTIKALHPQANHNCHCFIAAEPDNTSAWGYSDDGEPKGTAGLPMFQVLKHSDLGNVCMVVTRYFGGIKLGTGGIARAYSSMISMLLAQVNTELVTPSTQCTLFTPFHLTGFIEHILKSYPSLTVQSRDWTPHGQTLSFLLETHLLADFTKDIAPYQHEINLQQEQ